MQTPPTSFIATFYSHLFYGHLDIKDAQCAKKNYCRKISHQIIFCLGAEAVQNGRFGRPKIELSSKVAKFVA